MKIKPAYLFLFAMGLVLCFSCKHRHPRSTAYTYTAPRQLEDGLQTSSLGAERMDTAKIVALTRLILADTFPNIHSLLIFRNNKLVYENYFAGEDEITGLGHVDYMNHTRDDLHDCRSISKSFTSACIGIAVQQGLIKSIDEPIYPYFPAYAKYFDVLKRKITIRQLLTMTSGLAWNERISYADPKNSEIQMDNSADPVGFILSRPMAAAPGTAWNYNGGNPQLLEEILFRATGQRLGAFAAKYLFAPLGIRKFAWINMHGNMTAAAWGLRLRPRDMAKFGILYMNGGRWNNRQILDKAWVEQSISPLVDIYTDKRSDTRYGFLFWYYGHRIDHAPVPSTEANGNGGQAIWMSKKLQLLVVSTAGNYNHWDIVHDYSDAIGDYIFPAMK